MQEPKLMDIYLDSVVKQIRWRRAREEVTLELKNHMLDQKEAYMAEGMDEALAEDEVVRQMGDPIAVGTQLDAIHRPKTPRKMIVVTAVLIIAGLFIKVFLTQDSYLLHRLEYSMIGTLLGAGACIAAYYVDFSFIGRAPLTIYGLIIFLAIIYSLTRETLTFSRVGIHYISLFFPLAFGAFLYAMRGRGYGGFILCGVAYILQAMITLSAGNISGLIIIALSSTLLLLIATFKGYIKVKPWIAGLLILLFNGIVALTLLSNSYMRNRLLGVISPEWDPLGSGYLSITIGEYLKSSRLWGTGLSLGDRLLPNTGTDFLLTYLTHEYGWILSMVILLIFVSFIIIGFYLCFKQNSFLGLMVSTSVMLTLASQTVFYILTNLGFNLSSFSLPFMSHGNVYTIIDMTLLGIMLSVFRSGSLMRDKKESYRRKFIHYENGSIIISLK